MAQYSNWTPFIWIIIFFVLGGLVHESIPFLSYIFWALAGMSIYTWVTQRNLFK